jgi:predicted hydrocarbon binding protein
MSGTPAYLYPNRMGRILLESMEEVMGKTGLNALLNLAGQTAWIQELPAPDSDEGIPFSTIGNLLSQLETSYGPRGGHGIAIRIGRTAFKYGMRQYGSRLGLTETAFRLLPTSVKIRTGGRILADLFNRETDQRVSVDEKDGRLLWIIERCPICWGRHADQPVCQLAVGLLQESLYWLSSGKIFNVEETRCIAKGDPTCTMEIDSTPLA